MKKIVAVLIAVILMFNIVVFADAPLENREKAILASFSLEPEFNGDNTIIRLSELSKASGLGFSYNGGTGFLFAEAGEYGISIKELDENVGFDENAITIGSLPYSFKVLVHIFRQNTGSDTGQAILAPGSYYDGMDNVYAAAEVALELDSDKLQLTLYKSGTSNQKMDIGNIGGFLNNNLILVNKNNTLGREYTPSGLIYSKPARGRSSVSLRLDGEAMLNLNQMLEAAYDQGISGMVITSAFRTFEKQTSLFNNKTTVLSRKMNRKTAMEEASKVVAVPGSSEHQTGLAVDICSEGVGLVGNFGNTPQGKWMAENSWRFGFIIRYPKEKTEITGIIYEPWHVRYIGDGHSEIIKSRKLCFEEYVEYLKDNKLIYFKDSKGDDYVIRYIPKEDFNYGGMAISLEDKSSWSISNCTVDSYILTIKL